MSLDSFAENTVAAELTKYAIWLLSPLGLWIVLTALAAAGFFGRRQWRVRMVVLAQLQLLAFSLPWVGDTLLGQLEDEALVLEANRPLPPKVDAIVVLGGGLEGRYDGVRALPDLNDAGDAFSRRECSAQRRAGNPVYECSLTHPLPWRPAPVV